jgi:transposase
MIMQGEYHFESQGLVMIDMDTLISSQHILRKIDKHVDFSFIKKLTRNCYCSNNGRPSIDPEIFFRLMVVSYLYGISSDRQLCEQVRYNLAYRWFYKISLNAEVPEHSSLTRIWDRLGIKIFQEFFQEIIQQCKAKGLVTGKRIMTDGTLIEANASLNSLKKRNQDETLSTPQLNCFYLQPIYHRRLNSPAKLDNDMNIWDSNYQILSGVDGYQNLHKNGAVLCRFW